MTLRIKRKMKNEPQKRGKPAGVVRWRAPEW